MYVSTDTLHKKTADIDHTKDNAYVEELTKGTWLFLDHLQKKAKQGLIQVPIELCL